jgi:arylsulfatase A-like enzyme
MKSTLFSLSLLSSLCSLLLVLAVPLSAASSKPNIIWVMADDMGMGDLGCFGQTRIKTPNIDRMAAEGTRFTSTYCGTSVCAPSRASLMTGLHMGHCPIRANREIQPEGQMPLPKENPIVAELLKKEGYTTGLFGKWGLGFPGSGSEPTKRGFDAFYGYNCQRKAHNYFPPELWRIDERVAIPENADGKRGAFSLDLITAEMLKWVGAQKDKPFYLFFAATPPHGDWEVPDFGIYAKEDWNDTEKAFASQITRLDASVGLLLALLKKMGVDDRTLVIFTSDNGACESSGKHQLEFFDSNGPWRGAKRGMYEGSLREPTVARWPGTVPAGKVSDAPWAFWDFLPTALELAGSKVPDGMKVDGLSIAALLRGGAAPQRECFYWELHEGASKQAVRFGDWKAVRDPFNAPIELYDLKADPSETKNLASEHPDIIAKAEAFMLASRVDSPDFPFQVSKSKGKKAAPKR